MSGQVVDTFSLSAEKSEFASFFFFGLAPSLPSALVILSNLVIKLHSPLATQVTDVFTLSSSPAQLSSSLASGLTDALASVYGPIITLLLPLTKSMNNASAEFDSNTSSNLSSLDDEIGLNLGNEVSLELNNNV